MKSKQEIEFKIAVHEAAINNILKDTSEWNSYYEDLLENYLMGRKALLWVLSPDYFVVDDELDKKVKFEIACYTTSKIF